MSEIEKKVLSGTELRKLVKEDVKKDVNQRFLVHRKVSKGSYRVDSFTSDYTDYFIDLIIEKYQEEIIAALKEDKEVQIRSFMTIYVKKSDKKEKSKVRNPKTGETLFISPRKRLRVRPGKELRDFFENE